MILRQQAVPIAVLAAIATPAVHAEIAVGSISESDIVLEGLLQVDGNWFDNDLADLNGNGAHGGDSEFDLRRAQIVLKGKGPGQYEWVIGYDVKPERFLDVNVRYAFTGSDSQYMQVGQFKQPNGMEGLSSTRNNDFISKSAATNTYAVGRRLGAAYSFGNGVWDVTASWFSRELTRNFGHGNGYGLRSTWAPVHERGNIVHFGLAYVDYDTDADTFRVSARPNADLAAVRLVDTGDMIDTDRVATTSIEALWIRGPFKLQGEYYTSDIKRLANSDYTSTAGYIQGVWNLTGETWGYRGGVPTTPLPDQPGSGMWQLGLRYDTIDLNDGAVEGGQMNTWTSGVNWYWRSNFKFALNYVKVDSERQGLSDDPDIVEARVQFGW